MDFYTKIDIPKLPFDLDHKSKLLMLGSCFIESIGEQLTLARFDVNINPFGILYNPLSIAKSLEILINEQMFTEKDLFEYKEQFHSFYHHSRYSHTDKLACLTNINISLQKGSKYLQEADVLILTFGTSYVYQHKEKEQIVGNCHKLPAASFDRYRLSINEIFSCWSLLIDQLKSINPKLNILFTVSPIRHLSDGAHDNQLSKSTLLIAIDELCKTKECYYFPSYEIVLDELRDYRFFKEDMVHPTDVAISYIWERFGDTFFTPVTKQVMAEWRKIQGAIGHRPFNTEGDNYKRFLEQTLLKIRAFSDKYKYICCDKEIELLQEKIEDKTV